MPVPASATSVGAGSRSPAGKSGAGGTVKQRKTTSGAAAATRTRSGGGGGAAGAGSMWRFYTEDSPGLKVGPVPVLVMSLLFIASVFMLHIWGKYTRSWNDSNDNNNNNRNSHTKVIFYYVICSSMNWTVDTQLVKSYLALKTQNYIYYDIVKFFYSLPVAVTSTSRF